VYFLPVQFNKFSFPGPMVSVCCLSPAEGIGVRVGLFFMYTGPQAVFELGAFLVCIVVRP
jgi:hypothetical protein